MKILKETLRQDLDNLALTENMTHNRVQQRFKIHITNPT